MNTHLLSSPNRSSLHQRAFTLVELAAIVATLLLLGLIMAHGLASARDGGQSVHCLNNHRQLITAWQMYADENNGLLAMNLNGGSPAGGATSANRPWASGWLDWSTSTDNTNTLLLVTDKYSVLAKYFNREPKVYQCPADTCVSIPQELRGWTRRARSYSISMAIGGTSSPFDPLGSPYKRVRVMTDFQIPTAADAFVFIEEHPDSINDPAFMTPQPTHLVDAPASHHNSACVVTFADGHSEAHAWSGAAIGGRNARTLFQDFSSGTNPGDPDIRWLSLHSPRVRDSSY